MKRIISILILSFLFSVVQAQIVEHIYDFNSLQTGNLNGQDDWMTIVQTAGTADIFIDLLAGGVVAPDGTKAAYYTASGPGFGRTATRKATANFNFDFTTGDIIEMEFEMHKNWCGMFFGAGFDADGDGHIAPGLSTEEFDGGIYMNISSANPDNNKVVLPDGDAVQFDIENPGWCNYRMVLDFAANGGEGSVALFFDEGVTGVWEPVPEVDGVNMGLTPGSGDMGDRTAWDCIFFHSQGGTRGFDNIIIREPDNTGQQQYINFPAIADKFNTNPPFTLQASATSGLPITFTVVDGPAIVDGDLLTLTGETGFVTVKASQPGDTTWSAAPDVSQTFEVIDPLEIFPDIDVRNPLENGIVRAPGLHAVALCAATSIAYPHMLSVSKVEFDLGGQALEADLQSNGFFMAYWTPPDFGTYTLNATAHSSQGPTTTQTFSFEVVADAPALDINVVDMYSFQSSYTLDTTVILPSFAGTYTQVLAYLEYDCPCDPWDRIANIEIRGASGEFMELLRYITPYGVACSDAIDITDFVSQLQGKVDFHFSFTQSYVSLRFEYVAGTPDYPYSWIYKMWDGTYAFGDMENLQPLEIYELGIPEGTQDAYLRIISSGHGWGENNTGNAAEFYNATHYININGSTAYEQNLWQDCNPNPAGCQPQNGTWYYDRAGWCPGSIPILYRYELQPYLGGQTIEIQYQWDPDYVDYCHPSNPDCVSGVTCPDCNAGFDPHIVVAGEFVVLSNNAIVGVEDVQNQMFDIKLFPNPANDKVLLRYEGLRLVYVEYSLISLTGTLLVQGVMYGTEQEIDISGLPSGLYFVKVNTPTGIEVEKLVKE